MRQLRHEAVDQLRALAAEPDDEDAERTKDEPLLGLRPGMVIGQRFEIRSVLGSGGMGTVYRAWDRQGAAEVALKIGHDLDAPALRRFAREAEVLGSISHPGIVAYVAHGVTSQGVFYLAMELLQGESLHERLYREPLSIGETLAFGALVTDALAAAHAKGVVHRDIKPSNIYLAGGKLDHPRVLDFGLVRMGPKTSSLTQTGSFLGTPGYVAPEQVRGERIVDARADLFSLGCVLYECLVGDAAFKGSSFPDALVRVLLEEPVPLRQHFAELPLELVQLVDRLLAKAPGARPADALEVAQALRRLRAELGPAVLALRAKQAPAPVEPAPSEATSSEAVTVAIPGPTPTELEPTVPLPLRTPPQPRPPTTSPRHTAIAAVMVVAIAAASILAVRGVRSGASPAAEPPEATSVSAPPVPAMAATPAQTAEEPPATSPPGPTQTPAPPPQPRASQSPPSRSRVPAAAPATSAPASRAKPPRDKVLGF